MGKGGLDVLIVMEMVGCTIVLDIVRGVFTANTLNMGMANKTAPSAVPRVK